MADYQIKPCVQCGGPKAYKNWKQPRHNKKIADQYSVNVATINDIKARRTWRHISVEA